jgi:hypothetical protein
MIESNEEFFSGGLTFYRKRVAMSVSIIITMTVLLEVMIYSLGKMRDLI